MMVGALIAIFRAPGPRVGSAIQHFAAGTVFAAVALELLPIVVRTHAAISTVVGFAVGVALMLAIRELSMHTQARSKHKNAGSLGLVLAVGVDITIDGFLLGISFAAGWHVSMVSHRSFCRRTERTLMNAPCLPETGTPGEHIVCRNTFPHPAHNFS